jgi:PAS domain S-box-containing protein
MSSFKAGFMSSRLRSLLPRPTALGLAMIVAVLAGNMLVSEWNTQRLFEIDRRVATTQKLLTTLEELLARESEAEAAERGFLITDNPDFSRSYRRAVERVDETVARLSDLTAGDRWRQERVADLQRRIDARMEDLRRVIEAKRGGGFDAARQTVSTIHGRGLMDEIRDLVGEMQERVRAKLVQFSEESRRSARMTTITDVIGSLLGIGMVAVAFQFFHQDLANRRRAEAALRQLAAIVESSDDAIITKTLEGKIASWNAGAVRVYGYTAEEAIGRPATMLCPPERADEVAQNLLQIRRGERVEHFITQRVRRDGGRIDLSMSVSPVKDADGNVTGASVIARDVTETKALQREILVIADDEQRRIGQDLHDGAGQELTGLAMLAQRMDDELAAQASPEAALAAKIVEGLDRALRDVRAVAKGLAPVEIDAEGLTAALADLAARTGELHQIRCEFACRQPVKVLDGQTATHLYRISQEALANALKHGHPKRIAITLKADGELATLEVADDGAGFGESLRHSTGMGLRIMRYRAELIGAKLEIKPNVPSGVRVICTLADESCGS